MWRNYSPSSNFFQIWIFFDRFEVIVKNMSQPLNFRANFCSFWRLSPQNGARIMVKHELSNLHYRMHNSWKCANQLNNFWASKENVAIWQKNRFSHSMGQMDFSCHQTIRNDICLKCRDTIPLVEVCFRFELSLTVLKLESNLESTIEFLSKF